MLQRDSISTAETVQYPAVLNSLGSTEPMLYGVHMKCLFSLERSTTWSIISDTPYASINSKREHPHLEIPEILQRIPTRPAGICKSLNSLWDRAFAQKIVPYLNCINKPI